MAAKGAFFDVDGTLIGTNIVHAFGYYAMNQGSILSTALQTARTVLSVPLFWATDKLNRKLAAQLLAPGWTCDPAKARRVLGFEATVSLRRSVARTAGWYRDQGWI